MSEGDGDLRDRLASLEALMKEMLATMKSQATTSTAVPVDTKPVPPPENSGNNVNHATVEKFLKGNPITFDGSGEPKMADNWILDMESIFRTMT